VVLTRGPDGVALATDGIFLAGLTRRPLSAAALGRGVKRSHAPSHPQIIVPYRAADLRLCGRSGWNGAAFYGTRHRFPVEVRSRCAALKPFVPNGGQREIRAAEFSELSTGNNPISELCKVNYSVRKSTVRRRCCRSTGAAGRRRAASCEGTKMKRLAIEYRAQFLRRSRVLRRGRAFRRGAIPSRVLRPWVLTSCLILRAEDARMTPRDFEHELVLLPESSLVTDHADLIFFSTHGRGASEVSRDGEVAQFRAWHSLFGSTSITLCAFSVFSISIRVLPPQNTCWFLHCGALVARTSGKYHKPTHYYSAITSSPGELVSSRHGCAVSTPRAGSSPGGTWR